MCSCPKCLLLFRQGSRSLVLSARWPRNAKFKRWRNVRTLVASTRERRLRCARGHGRRGSQQLRRGGGHGSAATNSDGRGRRCSGVQSRTAHAGDVARDRTIMVQGGSERSRRLAMCDVLHKRQRWDISSTSGSPTHWRLGTS